MDTVVATCTRIQYVSTSDSVTVWWDRPEDVRRGRRYRVVLDDDLERECESTHCTFNGLEPNSSHWIRVLVDPCGDGRFRDIGRIDVRTRDARHLIDITQPPYCAVGDGSTLNTAAIQHALDDCTERDVVIVPAGTFMTGALRMHSHSELIVAKGAVLQGTADPADYEPRIWSRFEGIELECLSSLINIGDLDHAGPANCEDVVIRGEGSIFSGGAELMHNVIAVEKDRISRGVSTLPGTVGRPDSSDTQPGRVRPRLINMSNASHVTISGLTLGQSASWNVHMIYSDHVITHGCTIRSKGVFNGDGWDPDSSTDCAIFDCTFETGDDAIAIKSGKNPEGNIIGRPSRGIRIFDCRALYGFGITLGSEMSGGIEDVRIWDCDMTRTSFGLEIKGTRKRGGYVRDIVVHDSAFSHIQLHGVPYNDDGEDSGHVPVFERMRFDNISIVDNFPASGDSRGKGRDIEVQGFDMDHPVRNVRFGNVSIVPTCPRSDIDMNANGMGNIRLRYAKDVDLTVGCY